VFLPAVAQHFGGLQSVGLLQEGLGIEFVGEQGGPVNVVLELQAGVADVTSVEHLLHDKLSQVGRTYRCSSLVGVKDPLSLSALSLE
jgi:hypothetical protein